jgi:FMN phosphatase YigB (HAD superfamily)
MAEAAMPSATAQGSGTAGTVAAWLVDLDGTLYSLRLVKLAMVAELAVAGWSAMATLRSFRAEHERLRRELEQGTDDPYALQLQRTAAALGVPTTEVAPLVAEWMIRRPGKWLRLFRRRTLLAEIERFRRAGGRTALVSDYPAQDKLRALGARELFDVLVANGEPGGPGRLKPWPDGLLMAAERLAVAPETCLVLGDREDADGAAARAAGMQFRLVR